MHPQIPPHSKHFHEDEHTVGLSFYYPLVIAINGLPRAGLAIEEHNPVWTPIIAAVAVMEWEREAERCRLLAIWIAGEMDRLTQRKPMMPEREFNLIYRVLDTAYAKSSIACRLASFERGDWAKWGGWA